MQVQGVLDHSVRSEGNAMDPEHLQPMFIYGATFAFKHYYWDPKDGELFLSRMISGEILIEVRSDTDVQIVRTTWI